LRVDDPAVGVVRSLQPRQLCRANDAYMALDKKKHRAQDGDSPHLRAAENLSFGQQQVINARFSLSRTEPVPFGQLPLLLNLVFFCDFAGPIR
jgi:hypothetical protein